MNTEHNMTQTMTDNEIASARFHTRSCFRMERSDDEILRQLRQCYGWRDGLEVIIRQEREIERLQRLTSNND